MDAGEWSWEKDRREDAFLSDWSTELLKKWRRWSRAPHVGQGTLLSIIPAQWGTVNTMYFMTDK